jgi:hypothetical protein
MNLDLPNQIEEKEGNQRCGDGRWEMEEEEKSQTPNPQNPSLLLDRLFPHFTSFSSSSFLE